ncbi:hypothetical protein ABMA28_003801 [Loxostege sticticalis]|uniref:Cilia- and flagella-associated protein 61 N-terminal domain-containing protein n=1 Tax=Loxostege sticticalis TaxID=481309 RepID=A0ABD0ST28_LOXSC
MVSILLLEVLSCDNTVHRLCMYVYVCICIYNTSVETKRSYQTALCLQEVLPLPQHALHPLHLLCTIGSRVLLRRGADHNVLRCPAIKRRNLYKYYARRTSEMEHTTYIYTFLRLEFCTKLKMRRAVEEDNDDIVEILDSKCPRLRKLYGDYYLSELVGRHPESKRTIIVAEQSDRAVGVMCLNSEINYAKLDSTYELRPYYGLRKATPLEKEETKRANALLKTFAEPIMTGKWSPFQRMMKKEEIVEEDNSKENLNVNKSRQKSSKVYFGRNAARKSLEQIIYKHRHSDDYSDKVYVESPRQSQVTGISITDLLEEDPFDYEIVNIDNELLAIPEALSCDQLPTFSQYWIDANMYDIKKKRQSRGSINYQLKHTEESEIVAYSGVPNAFMIELYGFYDYVHERHSFDLLEAAFEIMKTLDYCIIRVPCKDKTFPLLQHFCYVPTKPKVCSKYALYVAHRSSVFGRLRVRPVEIIDIPQIAQMLQNVDAKETLWTIENSLVNKTHHYAYVFVSGVSIVGVGILEPPEQIDFIRAKFNLDLYHNHKYHFTGQGAAAGFSTLKAVIAYPTFEVHFRFFAREMMRLSGSSALFWLTAYRNKWVAHKANSLASVMVPLIPRKSEVDCTGIHEMKKIAALSKKVTAFSTWFLGRNLTLIPKVAINTRIVLVGASRTTMAFLDTLLFSDTSTYLTFTHVTLISPNGLPYIRQANSPAEMMFPRYRTSADKFLKSVPYTYYVNVVQGTMVDINKEDKYISLANGAKYYYDLLFLLLGKQHQHPNYLAELYERETEVENDAPYVRQDVPRLVESDSQISTEYVPDNVFIVNNITEGNRALKYVKNFFWQDFNYKVIVYGATISAYCCIAALMELKVPPENIVFVEPFPYENGKTRVPVFCNEYVDQSVREVLNNLNITVYRSYYFQSWIVDAYNLVTHVEFLSHFQMIKLDCAAFFYYGKTGVSAHALNAIKRSGLVYDGGLLIDHAFKTKDPSIYAAGPVTRYYRRYFADTYRLKYYDSYEVGEKLGMLIRNQLDPLFTAKEPERRNSVRFSEQILSNTSSAYSQDSSTKTQTSSSKSSSGSTEDSQIERLPILKKPIVIHCIMPGGLQYLEVRPPGKKTPHYYVQSKQYSGYVMETFKSGYFKLHMNNEHIVDGITCLSPSEYSLDNFKNLYGFSGTVLNNVHLRYSANKVDDFYSFFRQQWAFYLYHDRSDELFAMAKEILPKGQKNGNTLNEALRSIGHTLYNPSYRFNTRMRIRSRFEQSPHVAAITDYVMEWLVENDVLLPMYFQPEHQTEFSHDLDTNPIFVKKKKTVSKMMLQMF